MTEPPQIYRAVETLMLRAYIQALNSNTEADWAWAREVRKTYEKARLELGLGPDPDTQNAYWPTEGEKP